MSTEATSLVKSRSFGSVTRKAIALVLADYCDAAWSCFVGQARLAWESETSDRTARRTLADFESDGLIIRQHRYDDGGRRTSDRIVLDRGAISRLPARSLPDTVAGELAATDIPLPANGDATTGHSLAGEPPEGEPSEMNQTLPTLSVDDLFSEWYAVYPLHKGRGAALKAYRSAVKKVDPDRLLKAAESYRDDRNRDQRYTKHPATWLNQECWDDDPTPSTNGRTSNRAPIITDRTPRAKVVKW